ncbi:threonine synthase [Helicobacter burdigaliensis]|uniref:threonine synthase n=1 Tax=Helicobacter burdigaliensis TaxID=2315334 RepID=UPI000EF753F2|nr:threonine synthase [Helicobacter burdigaliensis]
MQFKCFCGTRGAKSEDELKSFQEVVLNPNAPFGGLYTLNKLPRFSQEEIEKFATLNYKELARGIFACLNLGIDNELLDKALALYDGFDEIESPAPLEQIEEDLSLQKLYCGPTRAFKDMALQPFGEIFSSFIEGSKEQYLILVATSGDTGPATLESFANRKNIKVICLYPKSGTSDVQRLQMSTNDAENVKVFGIDGDFDMAQSVLKELLKEEDFQKSLKEQNIALSAANSVNFGRIAFQMIYHIYASLKVYKEKQKEVVIIVPSGNFGNALGAFYAKMMGFPIKKIVIASNKNNILTEFIQTGVYDISNKTLQKTYSPAMDILKSSNVERVLFALLGAKRTKELMEDLDRDRVYKITQEELGKIQKYFSATFCEDEVCLEILKEYANKKIIIDPHTACGIKAYLELKESKEENPMILCSTAEWTKFAPTLARAFGFGELGDKEALEKIAQNYGVQIPAQISLLFNKKEVHTQSLQKEEVKVNMLKWLKGE